MDSSSFEQGFFNLLYDEVTSRTVDRKVLTIVLLRFLLPFQRHLMYADEIDRQTWAKFKALWEKT